MSKISDKEILAYVRGFIDLFIFYNQDIPKIRESCAIVLERVIKYHSPQCTTEMIASQNDVLQKLNLYNVLATEISKELDYQEKLKQYVKDKLSTA